MDTLLAVLTLITAAAAAVAGLLYLGRSTWRLFSAAHRISDLITRELTANGGSSIKDDIAATAVAVGELQRDVLDLRETKAIAHELLQVQLDTLTEAMGLQPYNGQHTKQRTDT